MNFVQLSDHQKGLSLNSNTSLRFTKVLNDAGTCPLRVILRTLNEAAIRRAKVGFDRAAGVVVVLLYQGTRIRCEFTSP